MRELQEEEAKGEHHDPCIPVECAPPTIDYVRMVDGIFDTIVNCEVLFSTFLTHHVEHEGLVLTSHQVQRSLPLQHM